jgi:hypothetical protein
MDVKLLNNIALPLADYYPDEPWEILLGYNQEKLMGDRVSQVFFQTIKAARQRNKFESASHSLLSLVP